MVQNEGKGDIDHNFRRFYETVCDIASYLDYTMDIFEDVYNVVKMEKCLLFDMSGRLMNLLNYSVFGVLMSESLWTRKEAVCKTMVQFYPTDLDLIFSSVGCESDLGRAWPVKYQYPTHEGRSKQLVWLERRTNALNYQCTKGLWPPRKCNEAKK